MSKKVFQHFFSNYHYFRRVFDLLANALKCWNCTSPPDEWCNDPFQSEGQEDSLIDCTNEEICVKMKTSKLFFFNDFYYYEFDFFFYIIEALEK